MMSYGIFGDHKTRQKLERKDDSQEILGDQTCNRIVRRINGFTTTFDIIRYLYNI